MNQFFNEYSVPLYLCNNVADYPHCLLAIFNNCEISFADSRQKKDEYFWVNLRYEYFLGIYHTVN